MIDATDRTTARSRILPIRRRPTDEDKLIFLIGPPLRHITGARIGDIARYPIGDPDLDRHEHYTCKVLIQHAGGLAEWRPIIHYYSPSWNSISGLHRLPHFAAEPLKRALIGRVRTLIATGGQA